MQDHPQTVILRHRRENLKKCSLRGLEKRKDIKFFTYPKDILPDLGGSIMLDLEGSPLTSNDAGRDLFIVDATWRLAEVMKRQLPPLERRSLPGHYRTAYPRKQEDCPNQDLGLASVEALYIAYYILGREIEGLLDHYYWKEEFLKKNNFC